MRKLGLAKSRALLVYRHLLRPCLMFFLTLFLLGLLLGLQQPQHLLYVWPLVGVQLALLLSNVGQRASEPRLEILAASGAVLVSSLAAGMPVAACLVLALKQILELTLLLWLLKCSVRCFDDLKTRNNVRRFFFAAIVVPFLTSPLMPHLALGSRSALGAWLGIALADSLGIAVFTPAILFLLGRSPVEEDQAFQRFPRRQRRLRSLSARHHSHLQPEHQSVPLHDLPAAYPGGLCARRARGYLYLAFRYRGRLLGNRSRPRAHVAQP